MFLFILSLPLKAFAVLGFALLAMVIGMSVSDRLLTALERRYSLNDNMSLLVLKVLYPATSLVAALLLTQAWRLLHGISTFEIAQLVTAILAAIGAWCHQRQVFRKESTR